MPEARAEIVTFVPVPVVVIPPGSIFNVHVPEAGNPLKATLPVPTVQFGWVIVPIIGAVGRVGTALITTSAETAEVQPASVVTE